MYPNLPTLLAALLAGVALLLVMRWVFAPSRPHPRRRRGGPPLPQRQPGDLGLLVALARGLPRDRADRLRALLGDASIRSSLSMRRDGAADVLVFADDADRARAMLPPEYRPGP